MRVRILFVVYDDKSQKNCKKQAKFLHRKFCFHVFAFLRFLFLEDDQTIGKHYVFRMFVFSFSQVG